MTTATEPDNWAQAKTRQRGSGSTRDNREDPAGSRTHVGFTPSDLKERRASCGITRRRRLRRGQAGGGAAAAYVNTRVRPGICCRGEEEEQRPTCLLPSRYGNDLWQGRLSVPCVVPTGSGEDTRRAGPPGQENTRRARRHGKENTIVYDHLGKSLQKARRRKRELVYTSPANQEQGQRWEFVTLI